MASARSNLTFRAPLRLGLLCGLSLTALAGVFIVPAWRAVCLPLHLFFQGLLIYANLCPNCGWFGPVVRQFRTNRKEVWLTIDDGPHPRQTPQILEVLRRFRARATFFVVGERVRAHPELARAIVAEGHTLASHSATHPSGWFWSLVGKAARWEISEGVVAIEEVTGKRPRWFRAPVGIANYFVHSVLRERGMRLIGWSARGFDTVSRNLTAVIQRIVRHTRPGAILLFHETSCVEGNEPFNVLALESLLARLRAEGYSCVVPREEQFGSDNAHIELALPPAPIIPSAPFQELTTKIYASVDDLAGDSWRLAPPPMTASTSSSPVPPEPVNSAKAG